MPWREGDPRLTNVTLALLGLALVLLAHQFGAEVEHFRFGFDHVSLLSAYVYVAAVLVVRTQPVNRVTLPLVVCLAVPMYALTYLQDPVLSSDIYRYVWDGIVQHAHISPYRYVPGNTALTFLRAPHQEIFDNINRRDYARTIYPPVAQMFYWLATWFAPTVEAMKLFMLGCLAVTAAALLPLLLRLGRPPAEVLLFLWCPLLVWEIGCAGHLDAVVAMLIVLAVLFRAREQPALVGLFLGMAVMTKFYPLVLVPALYQRRDWKMPAVLVAVCAVGYGMYASVGRLVFGFLSGYSKEEGIDSGSRFFLLDSAQHLPGCARLPKWSFTLFAALVMGGLALWAWRYATRERARRVQPASAPSPAYMRAATMLGFGMMLLFSPHYGWYNVWLVPFLLLAPSVPLYVYVLGFFYGYTTALADPGPKMFLLNEYLYAGTALAFALHFVLKRWPMWARLVTRERAAQDRVLAGAEREALVAATR